MQGKQTNKQKPKRPILQIFELSVKLNSPDRPFGPVSPNWGNFI